MCKNGHFSLIYARQWIAFVKYASKQQHMTWKWAIQKGSKSSKQNRLKKNDIYVALLSCFHSLMHLKVELIELVKKIFRCCIYIDVTTLPYDIALKLFPKYAFGAFVHLYINRYR